MDTLTVVMRTFEAAFKSGITSIIPMAKGLWGSLLLIDFVWSMSKAALTDGSNYLKIIVEKSLRYTIFLFFITQYQTIFEAVLNSFITVGLTAGGNQLTAASFADPSWLITKGFTVVEPITAFIKKVSPLGVTLVPTLLLLAIVYFLIIAAFFIMAIQVFITYLEVYVVGTLAVFFLGCGVNKHTAFLAEKSIGAVLSFAIKLMTLAFILSISGPILNTIVVPVNDDNLLTVYLQLLAGIAAIAFLCWQAPSLAAGLMAGSPSLSAGGVAGAAMAGGAALIGGAMAAKSSAAFMSNLFGGGAAAGGAGGAAAGAAGSGGISTPSQLIQQATAGGGLSGQDGVFNTGQYGTDGGSGGSTGIASNQASSMSAASVADRVDPSLASREPGSSGNASSSATSGAAMTDTSTGSDQAGSSSTASDTSSTPSGASSAAPAINNDTKQSKNMNAANIASRIALAKSAIPEESSPQGGVGAPLQHEDD